MEIEKNAAVTLSYKVLDDAGKLMEESSETLVYLHGGYGNTFTKIEEALQDQTAGCKTTLQLASADAFGERDESLVQTVPKSQFRLGVTDVRAASEEEIAHGHGRGEHGHHH